jgi:UDP-N-acetyl-D-glucosamine dehydrogenase
MAKSFSTSPITGTQYAIPSDSSARQTLDDFLATRPDKPVVAVQGLGFVGAVMSLVVANAKPVDYTVLGVDIDTPDNYWKIASINSGTFPIISADPLIPEYYEAVRAKGNLLATSRPEAYAAADIIIVDINLDVAKKNDAQGILADYSVDLAPFSQAIETIGGHCKPNALILVETTVPPGTCEKIVKPIIQSELTKRGLSGNTIKIAHSYERVTPGRNYINSIINFYRVYSGTDENSAEAAEQFLKTIIKTDEYPLTRLGSTTASEMAKVLENSYRAANIAFIVEWSRFAEEAGVNLYEVCNAIRLRPTHRNIMLPGIGVGGYCLTKDPLLASWARENLFGTTSPLSTSVAGVQTNDLMPSFAYQFLKRNFEAKPSEKSITLLGVSYLNDVGDTRFTPVESFYDHLLDDGWTVSLHDPYVSHWVERSISPSANLSEAVNHRADVIAITTGHSEYRSEHLVKLLMARPNCLIYDTIGVLSEESIHLLKTKHQVKVLGRGDL